MVRACSRGGARAPRCPSLRGRASSEPRKRRPGATPRRAAPRRRQRAPWRRPGGPGAELPPRRPGSAARGGARRGRRLPLTALGGDRPKSLLPAGSLRPSGASPSSPFLTSASLEKRHSTAAGCTPGDGDTGLGGGGHGTDTTRGRGGQRPQLRNPPRRRRRRRRFPRAAPPGSAPAHRPGPPGSGAAEAPAPAGRSVALT